ncbi:MAG: hypothetical protein FJW23_17290 [Acidimicrobiia bacterium]|nr:hypothetical protein [Acidimicrobiia bacterium]
MSEKGLKSRFDLMMERLAKEDAESGVEQRPLTDAQKAVLAEIRNFYDAKLAEVEVLHQGKLRAIWEPGARAELEAGYRRDRERLTSERDAKLERARRDGV